MNSKDVRQAFLQFFESKTHKIVPSAPMVLKNDPTLMFTNAGMNQFKDYFLGDKDPAFKRAADTQKCLRVSGKHNDLEEVGVDTYHHTMFEMLGNWSFGDYFKKEAIDWAWEFLVDKLNLPVDRIYITIFEGDKKDGLTADTEARELWKAHVAADRILEFDKKDNFWEMGETGPCGPCSEIHVDLRSEEEIKKVPGHKLVNMDDPQVIEIWNLVFIQYNRFVDGSLKELPAKHIDTGMGLERLVRVLQNKESNYDTDVFTPLISRLEQLSGKKYGNDNQIDVAIRVCSDHIRAVAFSIADGQLPSNTGAGYVIRRILRRAVRYGYTFLDCSEPFLNKLVPVLTEQFDGVFPELVAQKELIVKVVTEEEQSFLNTLEKGLGILENLFKSEKKVSGDKAFELYDTYGFPLDLTQLIARERGYQVDVDGFHEGMKQQKERSKAAAESTTDDWVEVTSGEEAKFIGYDHLEATAKIIKYRAVSQKNKTFYQLVFDQTPFYAESGGQVGDTGFIQLGESKISVTNTIKENDLILHITDELPPELGAEFNAVVNKRKRKLTTANHSATHLMHAALKSVLGDHVNQKGSLVDEKVLRFDFSHFSKIEDDQLQEIETIVNEKIRENIPLLEERSVPINEAVERGATALFGEKYGDEVRVITFDKDYSMELCGGTHVDSTGEIGLFKIVSESSIAAGIRRIEAITSEKAVEFINQKLKTLDEINELLKSPKDVLVSLNNLIKERSAALKKLESIEKKEVIHLKQDLKAEVSAQDGMNVLIKKVEIGSADGLKKLAFMMKGEVSDLFMVLAANVDQKPMLAIVISESVVEQKGLDAGKLIRELAKPIQGGGGGQPFFATAGGKNLQGLDQSIEEAKKYITELV